MAAYYKVEVSLGTNAVEVGIPSPQTVNVVLPLIGPQGAQGPAGTTDFTQLDNVPATFPPSAHTHVAADVTDFAAAVAAVSPPVDWATLTGKPSTFAPSAHTHPISEVTSLQTALDGKAATSHTHTSAAITDFAAAVVAAAPPTTDASLLTSGTLADARLSAAAAASLAKADTASQPGHTHSASAITDFNSAVTALVENEVRFDSNGNFTYTGQAAPNTSESTAAWRIRRSEYTGAGTHVATLTANNVRWDHRLTASYS